MVEATIPVGSTGKRLICPGHLAIALMVLVLSPILCHGAGLGELVGDYALEPKGQVEFKVSKNGDQYFVTVREGKQWLPPDKLVICNENDYSAVFGPNWKQITPVGLRLTNGPFAIFKVKKGATLQNHTFKTGYFMMFMGAGDVYKL